MGICYVPYKLPYLPKAGYLNPAADDTHFGAPFAEYGFMSNGHSAAIAERPY